MTSVTEGAGRRVGILGGTFDPPHIGHLVAAVSARHTLGLDEVLLVPNGDPWQKSGLRAVTPARQRLAMVEAAAGAVPGLAVSDLEVRRPGASYTVDTISEMVALDPGLRVVVVMGRDAAAGLTTWHRWEELADRADIAVVSRSGDHPFDPVVAAAVTIHPVEMPLIDVSSTDLRRRVSAGEPIDVLVPAAVVDHIHRHRLYREAGAPTG